MMWWFVMLAVAVGAVLWAALAAYLRVHQRLRRAENRPAAANEPDSDHPH